LQRAGEMQGQSALPDAPLARSDRDDMAHASQPADDAGALPGNLFEHSGPAVADDVVITLHRAAVTEPRRR